MIVYVCSLQRPLELIYKDNTECRSGGMKWKTTNSTLVTVWKIKGANKGGLSNIKCTCTFNLHTITLIDTASKLYTF